MTEEEHELPILLVAPAPARHAGETAADAAAGIKINTSPTDFFPDAADALRRHAVGAVRQHDRLTRRAHHGTGRWRQPCSGGTPSLSDQATLPWRRSEEH